MNEIAKKSVDVGLVQLTQIARSLRTPRTSDERKRYVTATVQKFYELCRKLEDNSLTTGDIRKAIGDIAMRFDPHLTFGQAQKGLNVLLKYQFNLFHEGQPVGDQLDCPLDNDRMTELNRRLPRGRRVRVSLRNMTETQYTAIQSEIANLYTTKVEFDLEWDKKTLNRYGLLPPDA